MPKFILVFLLALTAPGAICQPLKDRIAAIEKGLTHKDPEEKKTALLALKQVVHKFGIEATYPLIPALGISRTYAPNSQFQDAIDTLLLKYPDRRKVLSSHLKNVKALNHDAQAQGHILAFCVYHGRLIAKDVGKDSTLVPLMIDVIRLERDLSQQHPWYALAAAVAVLKLYYYAFPDEEIHPSTIETLAPLLYKKAWKLVPIWHDLITILPRTRDGILALLKYMDSEGMRKTTYSPDYLIYVSNRLTPEMMREKDIESLLISVIDNVKGKSEEFDRRCCMIIRKMGPAAQVFIPYLAELLKRKPGEPSYFPELVTAAIQNIKSQL